MSEKKKKKKNKPTVNFKTQETQNRITENKPKNTQMQQPYLSKLKAENKFLAVGKKIWNVIAVISIIYSFITSSLIFSPEIEIVYNSYIIPKNSTELPIRIINHSIFSVYNVYITYLSNLSLEGGNNMIGDQRTERLANEIVSKEYKDSNFAPVFFEGVKPLTGEILVEVSYEYTFLKINYKTAQKFGVYRNTENNELRWIAL